MEIENLRIFARVALVRNLSQVGKEFGLTPGTISKKLQAMEDELGVRLFDRTTRSIRITEEGQVFLPFADEIVSDLDAAKTRVDETISKTRGKLRVSAPTRIGGMDTASCICEFLECYPEVEICLDTQQNATTNNDELWDVAIRTGNLSDSTFIAQRLADDTQVIVASPNYLEKYGPPKVPKDLAHHSCLCVSEKTQWTFQKQSEKDVLRVRGKFISGDIQVLQIAALQGQGILRCSKADVFDHIRAGRLVRLLGTYDVSESSAIWAIYPSARYTPPRLRAFVDHVRRALRRVSYNDGIELNKERDTKIQISQLSGDQAKEKLKKLSSEGAIEIQVRSP